MQKLILILFVLLCFTPWVSPPVALLMGIIIAQVTKNPFLHNKRATSFLLQFCVVGLGFGMNINTALKAGKSGFLFSALSIVGTLALGVLLGKLFKTDKKTSFLISGGTAVCGGSAIAAISPVIEGDEKQITAALGIVFILNAVALFVFPYLGNAFNLTDTQYGLWCAMAIHDTSSVVGAASVFGPHALEIATTVKLARALWIIPITIATSIFFKKDVRNVNIPYFIGFFILAIFLNSYMPGISTIAPFIVIGAKKGLILALFFIGAGLSNPVIKSVGAKPFLQGLVLWCVISLVTLLAIIQLT